MSIFVQEFTLYIPALDSRGLLSPRSFSFTSSPNRSSFSFTFPPSISPLNILSFGTVFTVELWWEANEWKTKGNGMACGRQGT